MTSSSNTIQASKRQAGNDLLKKLTRCPYTLVDIEPDFIVGRTACVLYLSVRFHALHPNYIYERVNRLGDNFELRVLLVNIDHVEHKSYLMELTKLSIRSNLTLMLSWTIEDAAMILEKLKLNEDKPPDGIMEKPTSEEYGEALDQYVIDAIAENRYITRVDAAFLVSLFGSFEHLVAATPEDYSLCYGVGFQKGQKLYDLLHRPMKRGFEARSSGRGGSSYNGGSSGSGDGADHVVLETCESAERTTTLTENASCTFANED